MGQILAGNHGLDPGQVLDSHSAFTGIGKESGKHGGRGVSHRTQSEGGQLETFPNTEVGIDDGWNEVVEVLHFIACKVRADVAALIAELVTERAVYAEEFAPARGLSLGVLGGEEGLYLGDAPGLGGIGQTNGPEVFGDQLPDALVLVSRHQEHAIAADRSLVEYSSVHCSEEALSPGRPAGEERLGHLPEITLEPGVEGEQGGGNLPA